MSQLPSRYDDDPIAPDDYAKPGFTSQMTRNTGSYAPYAARQSGYTPIERYSSPRRPPNFTLVVVAAAIVVVVAAVVLALLLTARNPAANVPAATTAPIVFPTSYGKITNSVTVAAAASTTPDLFALPTITPIPLNNAVDGAPTADPTRITQLLAEGKTALDSKDWNTAIARFADVLQQKPDDRTASAQLAFAYYQRAITADAIVSQPNSYESNIESLTKALNDLDAALKFDVSQIKAQVDERLFLESHFLAGYVALHDQRWEDAIPELRQVYDKNRSHRNVVTHLYQAYIKAGDAAATTDKAKALLRYDAARQLSPLSDTDKAAAERKYQSLNPASPTPPMTVTATATAAPVVVPTDPPTQVPPVSVPGVVGESRATAIARITGAGLTYNEITQCSDYSAAGSVIGQNPGAGANVLPGTTITLTVSTGGCGQPVPTAVSPATIVIPRMVQVPNILRYRPEAAEALLRSLDLVPVVGNGVCSNTAGRGLVAAWEPGAGATVMRGTQVVYHLSTGGCG